MIGLGEHTRVAVSPDGLPVEYQGQLDGDELELVQEVGARADTACIYLADSDTGKLLAYAIFGRDDEGLIAVYALRSWLTGLGQMMLKQLFGTARVCGAPLRVHSEKVKAFARGIGATDFLTILDADGVQQGVFHG